MRPLPSPSEYGQWDALPVDPPNAEWDLNRPDVRDGLARREILINQWHAFRNYPHDFWRVEAIRRNPDQGEAWRNWFLRRSWEAINRINLGLLKGHACR